MNLGSVGTGKSHLAAALGTALVDTGRGVLFTRTTDLVQKLQAARRDLALPATLAKLDRFDCLVLDDLGYVRKDQAETTVLFEFIAERYERKSLITTCNQPFSCSSSTPRSHRRRVALRKYANDSCPIVAEQRNDSMCQEHANQSYPFV